MQKRFLLKFPCVEKDIAGYDFHHVVWFLPHKKKSESGEIIPSWLVILNGKLVWRVLLKKIRHKWKSVRGGTNLRSGVARSQLRVCSKIRDIKGNLAGN